MTIFFEASRPFQQRGWVYKDRTMIRVGWAWFAAGWLRVPFKELCTTAYDWRAK